MTVEIPSPPTPTAPEEIRDILHSMLEMSHDEIQWGAAEVVEFTAENGGAFPSILMQVGDARFRVEVRPA